MLNVTRHGFRAAALAITLLAGTAASTLAPAPSAQAASLSDAKELVAASQFAFDDLMDHGTNATIRSLLKDAKGVMIFPSVIKGAVGIGGEGGSGVLMVRGQDGVWSYPAFYHMSSISLGFQLGGQETRFLMILMTDRAVQKVMTGNTQIGGDLSAAAVESGVEKSTGTTTGRRDIYYHAETEGGLFAGVSVEGSRIKARNKMASKYYGYQVSPRDIVIERRVTNPQAEDLRTAISSQSGL
jgi:lipid-binding SYLF domain-containing protein